MSSNKKNHCICKVCRSPFTSKDKFKDLWLLIRANPFAAIIAAVTALAATAAVLYTQFSMTSQATKDLTNELETQHQTTELLSRTIKRQIDLLTAQGGSEREIIAVKEKLIQSQIMELETSLKLHQRKIEDVKDNDSLWESTLKLAGAIQSKMGNQAAADNFEKSIQLNKQERAKEDLEAIAKEKQDLLDLQNNIKVLSAEKINIDKKETEEYKKELDKRKEDRKKLTDYYKEIDAEIAAAKLEDATKAKTEEDLAAENAIAKNLKAMSDAKALSDYRIAEKEREEKDKQALEQQTFDQSVALAQQSTAAIGDLSNLLFDLKRRNMVKGSAQELKLAKRQFAIQKALAITNTVISTVQGMIKAIANNPPPSPIGIIGAALTGVAGTVATATIASKKFMGDGGGGDSGGGGAGSVSIPQPPTIAPPSQGNTDLNPDGTIKNKQSSQPVIKAFVVETDVTKTQKTVKQIEDKAKL